MFKSTFVQFFQFHFKEILTNRKLYLIDGLPFLLYSSVPITIVKLKWSSQMPFIKCENSQVIAIYAILFSVMSNHL